MKYLLLVLLTNTLSILAQEIPPRDRSPEPRTEKEINLENYANWLGAPPIIKLYKNENEGDLYFVKQKIESSIYATHPGALWFFSEHSISNEQLKSICRDILIFAKENKEEKKLKNASFNISAFQSYTGPQLPSPRFSTNSKLILKDKKLTFFQCLQIADKYKLEPLILDLCKYFEHKGPSFIKD
jgi:hypothetical protein